MVCIHALLVCVACCDCVDRVLNADSSICTIGMHGKDTVSLQTDCGISTWDVNSLDAIVNLEDVRWHYPYSRCADY